jgi:uncharacterized protein (TIGR02246 family)
MGIDEQQIRQLVEEWHRRTAQNDLEGVLALMADDAIFLTCGRPPMSKQEFAAGFAAWAGRSRIESKHEFKDLHASGDIAYAWSHISVAMVSGENGSKTERSGHVLTVFRKSPAGKWQLVRDANLLPPGKPEKG